MIVSSAMNWRGLQSMKILLLIPIAACICAAPTADEKYDYIVVGSGPGGGTVASNLARAGHNTLLIEAGDDESSDPFTNVASFFSSTGIHDNYHWDFWVSHYDEMKENLKFQHLTWRLPNGDLWVGPGSAAPKGAEVLGVHYPRGATLGGSTIINAGAVFLPGDGDWDFVAGITGDDSWR
jgi:choline dehydrogenase